jgi:hypothetical protein
MAHLKGETKMGGMTLLDTSKMIFVFGSNEAGRHGAGAALYAFKNKGAIYGAPFGLVGKSFAIPTLGMGLEQLSVEVIGKYVEIFLNFAERWPNTKFQVTCIGCGLGGKTHADIAPLFRNAPDNCYFDRLWQQWLPDKKFWGTF